MGGNMRDAGHARKKKERKRKREEERKRLQEQIDSGKWMHLTVSIDEEAHELWVRSAESDAAVRLRAQEYLAKDYARELSKDARWGQVRDILSDEPWIAEVRHTMPDSVETNRKT